MKRKILTFILSLCLVIPAVMGLTACGGYGEQFSKANLEKAVSSKYFVIEAQYEKESGDFGYDSVKVMDNVYSIYGNEYVKETVDSQTEYFTYNSGIKTPIESTDYVDYASDLEVVVNFIKSIAGNFKEDGPYYTYKGEFPADVKSKVEQYTGKEYNCHSILVDWNPDPKYARSVFFMTDEYEVIEYDENSRGYDLSGRWELRLAFFNFAMSNYKADNIVDTMKNYTVKGGEGLDYMEFYFTETAMRYVTPNVVEDDANLEAILSHEGGVYKYFKRTKTGPWQLEIIEEEDYWNRYKTMSEVFAGGILFDNLDQFDKKDNTFVRDYEISAGNMGLYTMYYDDIVLNVNDRLNITSGSWTLKFESSTSFAQSLSYKYNLTVGDAVITLPTA